MQTTRRVRAKSKGDCYFGPNRSVPEGEYMASPRDGARCNPPFRKWKTRHGSLGPKGRKWGRTLSKEIGHRRMHNTRDKILPLFGSQFRATAHL